jgi:hypothetical protein
MSHGGATIAYVTDVKDDLPVVYAAVAYCHENDAYNKKLGRTKAAGRLLQLIHHGGDLVESVHVGGDKFFTVYGDDVKGAIDQIAKELEIDTGYSRVREET